VRHSGQAAETSGGRREIANRRLQGGVRALQAFPSAARRGLGGAAPVVMPIPEG
jgi:hypothetical protein